MEDTYFDFHEFERRLNDDIDNTAKLDMWAWFMKEVHHIRSIKEKIPPSGITNEESPDPNQRFELQYDILEHIFTFLSSSDLRSALLVNSVWSEVATRELQKRTSAALLTCKYDDSDSRFCMKIQTFNSFHYSDVAFCFFVVWKAILSEPENLIVHYDDSGKTKVEMKFHKYLEKEAVPNNSDSCVVRLMSYSYFFEDNEIMFQGIFLPRIPNIRIVLYNESSTQVDGFEDFSNQLKCLLLFTSMYCTEQAKSFLKKALNNQTYTDVALGGGLIQKAETFPRNQGKEFESSDFLCIAFMEVKNARTNFDAYSVVIENNSKFEEKVIAFKKKTVLRKDGALLWFSNTEPDHVVGESMVSKYFPSYPIFKVEDIRGVFGWNTVGIVHTEPMKSSSSEQHNHSDTRELIPYLFTSTLVFITWGNVV